MHAPQKFRYILLGEIQQLYKIMRQDHHKCANHTLKFGFQMIYGMSPSQIKSMSRVLYAYKIMREDYYKCMKVHSKIKLNGHKTQSCSDAWFHLPTFKERNGAANVHSFVHEVIWILLLFHL